MKKKIFALLILFMGVITVRAGYNRPTPDEVYLDEIGVADATITVKTVDPEDLYEDYCIDREGSHCTCEDAVPNEIPDYFYEAIIQTYLQAKYSSFLSEMYSYVIYYPEEESFDICIFTTEADEVCRSFGVTFDIDKNASVATSVGNLSDSIEDEKLTDLQVLNYYLTFNSNNDRYSIFTPSKNTFVLRAYPKLRAIIDNNPTVTITNNLGWAGASIFGEGYGGSLGFVVDERVYGFAKILLETENTIYVDEDSEDYVAAAEARIAEFLDNDNIELVVACDPSEDECDSEEDIIYSLYIDDELIEFFSFRIVGVAASEIPKSTNTIKDGTSGVYIIANGRFPLDVDLEIVKGTGTSINNVALPDGTLAYYNILLYSQALGLITSTNDDVEVYIPLTGTSYIEGAKVNVYHILENGTVSSTIEGTIVKIGSSYYVKFVTNHFSIYAIGTKSGVAIVPVAPVVNPITAPVDNPNTYDEIIRNIFIVISSTVCLTIGLRTYRKANKKYN
ncbi:MAG TPA: hypothetical protein PK737_02890 [Bacilli bacterium]|nr:hypothetical protein [Bacilli bacterium]